MACASGQYSNTTNATSCTTYTPCAPGTRVDVAGTSPQDQTCVACDPGTYTDQPNLPVCLTATACPAGTEETQPATLSSAAVCRTCAAGEFCPGGATAATSCGGSGAAATWDHDGDVVVGGKTDGALPGTTALGATDGFVTFMASTSAITLHVIEGTSSDDLVQSVVAKPNGHVGVAGSTLGAFPTFSSAGGYDVFVDDLTSAGSSTLLEQLGGDGSERNARLIADASSNYVLAFDTDSVLEPGAPGTGDVVVRSYASNGMLSWMHQYDGGDPLVLRDIAFDPVGSLVVTAWVNGAYTGQTALGAMDTVNLYLDSSGVLSGATQWGPPRTTSPTTRPSREEG